MNYEVTDVADIIRDVAKTIVLPHWRHLGAGDILEKSGPNDLVTVADRACEKELAARLTSAYPGTLVVGEEGVEADPSLMERLESGEAVWVIDPIDGTMAFSQGREEFDVMVALVKNAELLAGWIYAPVTGEFYMGQKGSGVFLEHDGKREKLKPVSAAPLTDLTGILGKKSFSDEQRQSLKSRGASFKKIISTICAGHDYSRLVNGTAQFAIYNKCMPWDHTPGLALASELGFAYTKHDGSPYHPWHTDGGLMIGPKDMQMELRRLFFD
jgi:fructose-1,6-bisphosphatase/inositol monophosphatase family enzyme